MSKITRRETLAGGGKVIAAAAVLPVIPTIAHAMSDGEDSELIALWQRHQELWEDRRSLQAAEDRLYPHRETRKREYTKARDRTSQAWGEITQIEHQIATTPANTFAGIAIKLRVPAKNIDNEGPDDPYDLNLKNALADAERLAGGVV